MKTHLTPLLRMALLCAPLAASADPAPLLWEQSVGAAIYAIPAVHDGRVYFGAADHHFHVLEAATGEWQWSFPTGGTIKSSAVIYAGRAYFGSGDNKLYCLDIDPASPTYQTKLWDYSAGQVKSSPAEYNGAIFAGCNDATFVSLDAADGSLNWPPIETDAINKSSPTVRDGVVFFGSNDGKIRAAWCEDGTHLEASGTLVAHVGGGLRWTCTTTGAVISSPYATATHVYCGNSQGEIYKLDIVTGEVVWVYSVLGDYPVISSPVVVDGYVYIGSDAGFLHVLDDATGEEDWSFPTGGPVGSSPLVVGGVVYFGSRDHYIYAVSLATQEAIWTHDTGGDVLSSPVLAGGRLYCGSLSGSMFCFELRFIEEIYGWERLDDVIFREDAPIDYPILGGTRDLKMRVYLPTGTDIPTRRPALLGFPGGSFNGVNYDHDACTRWARRGYTVFSISCRRRADDPPAPAAFPMSFKDALAAGIDGIGFDSSVMIDAALCQFEDALHALAYIRDHAAEFGVDPARLAMAGTSSGNVTMTNVLYCATDLGSGVLPGDIGGCHSGAFALPTAEYLQSGEAPLFMVHGLADLSVLPIHAETLHAALVDHGIPTELYELAGVGHFTLPPMLDWAYAADGSLLITQEALFFYEHLDLATIDAPIPRHGYVGWITASGVAGMQQAEAWDPDGDTWANLTEYALLGTPTTPEPAAAPLVKHLTSAGRRAVGFKRDTTRNDVTITVEAVDPTGTVTPLATSIGGAPFSPLLTGVTITGTSTGTVDTVKVRDASLISATDPARYLRVAVSR